VAATAVAEHQQRVGLRIVHPGLFIPPELNARARKLGRVAAGVQMNRGCVLCHVVDAVRDHLAVGVAREIMIINNRWLDCISDSVTMKTAQ